MSRVRAPEFPHTNHWFNLIAFRHSDAMRPLSLAELRGRIVLLDFWTYGCINCLHILPDLKYLEHKYADYLTVIGVHSAKFDQEKSIDNIRQAILRYDIEHPVVVDQNFEIWQQYAVRAYPTMVLIDPQGYVVSSVSGEGNREILDELIGKLIEKHEGTIDPQVFDLILEKNQAPLLSPLAFPGKILADEASDRFFIADSGHHRIVVSTLDGKVLGVIGTGQPGLQDGSFGEAQFCSPQGMAYDLSRHQLFVADTGNHTIRRIDFNQETVVTIAGTGAQNQILYPHGGKALETALNSPWDLVCVGNRLLIAMAGSHQIWQLDLLESTVETFLGTGAEGCVDGRSTEAAFAQPSGIATHGEELFTADSETSSVRSIELQPIPEVKTICGSGSLYGFGDRDGVGEAAQLQHCLGIEYCNECLWIADTYNHKIKAVSLQDRLCTTVLGNGEAGDRDAQGIHAQFFEPSGISATRDHLYVADTNNHKVRRIALKDLTVTTLEFPSLCAPDLCFPNDV